MPRLEIDIEVAADAGRDGPLHVHGTLRREGGAELGFVGWVSLLALLEQAVGIQVA